MRTTLLAIFVLSAQALVLKTKPASNVTKLAFDDHKNVEVSDESPTGGLHSMVHEQMKPGDAGMALGQFQTATLTTKIIYLVTNAAVLGMVAVMYRDRSIFTVISIMALILSLSLMSNTIQEVYKQGFQYPQFITSCHQIFSCAAAFTVLLCRQKMTGGKITYPTVETVLKGLLPVAVCFAASLGAANLCLLSANTHFYEMLTPASPIATFALGVALGQKKSMRLLPPLLILTVALPFVAFGDAKGSLLGLALAMASVAFRACKATLQNLLMSADGMAQTFHPVELLCWTSMLTFGIMFFWSLVNEGLAPYKQIGNTDIFIALLVSCINATILNLTVLFVMREIGPVAQMMLGELKGVLACLGAVAAFGEVVTVPQMVSYTVACVSLHWYNHVDKEVRAEAADQKKSEGSQSEKA